MKIYVQSRGYSQDFEYCWQPEVPSLLQNISGLIQSESSSVVIARFDKQLMLLVTGLESPQKKDFRDRSIRHSIAWVCNDNLYDERQIRAIAVQALRGLLASQVDKYINFGGESGFEPALPKIQELSESFLSAEIEQQDLPPSEESHKIAQNSQDLRDDLAYKLQLYSLPKNYQLLVVVTGIKSAATLENARIWRSLSNLVKSANWRDLSRGEGNNANFGVAIAIIAVIAIAFLILLVVLLHPFNPKPEVTPSPRSQVIEETSQSKQNSSLNSFSKDLTPSEKDLIPLENLKK
jgi:hypothetical protein